VEGGFHAKNQLDSSSRFDTIPACDVQTDGQMDTLRQQIGLTVSTRIGICAPATVHAVVEKLNDIVSFSGRLLGRGPRKYIPYRNADGGRPSYGRRHVPR